MHYHRKIQSSPSVGFILKQALQVLAGAAVWLFLSACSHLSPTIQPIPTQAYPFAPDTRAETLVIFLPGRGGGMQDFARHGFIEQMRAAGIKADALTVDAHLGYYYRRSIITRLEQDVLRPAREQGYRRIVVVGISLGGLGALLCARDLPNLVDGLVLISPYLGKRTEFFDQIRRAGGPAAWSAGRAARASEVDEEIWTFLGQHSNRLPPTYLCLATRDYLQVGQNLFSELLPPSHVITLPGAHNWKTWQQLWQRLCLEFPSFAGPGPAAADHRP